MWTTGIAPLCSSSFVIGKIVLDRVMPNLNCAVQFSHYSFPPFQSWWEWLIQNCLCFCCCFCQLTLLFTLAFFSAFGYSIPHTLLPLFLHTLLFRQRQVTSVPLLSLHHGSLYSFHSAVDSNLYIYLEYRASDVSFTVFQRQCECC